MIPAPRVFAPVLRRTCACGGTPGPAGECGQCRRKRQGLQRSASAAAPAVAPPIVHDVLRSPGTTLDRSVRAEMEPRFRHSFADVRVHADSSAAESARAVGAHAYAVGRDVVFAAGRYAPGSAEGRRLIAHELAHVVQQRGSAFASLQPMLEVGAADDPAEREADRAADAVLAGRDAGAGRVPGAPVLRRYTACGTVCPPREPGELARARSGPIAVEEVHESGTTGLLVSNFAGESADVKGLESHPRWAPFWGRMVTSPDTRWRVSGFTDCHGDEGGNEGLRWERAIAVNNLLPTAARAQVDGFRAAPAGQCHDDNSTAVGRSRNRSVLIERTSVSITFPPETVVGRLPVEACFDGTTVYASKGGMTASCPAVTGTAGAPSPRGRYCIRPQGEAQVGGGIVGRLVQDRAAWFLLEPQFSTPRFRMQLHPGTMSEGCVTVTGRPCFDTVAAVLNQPGRVSATGYDGYPPGNGAGVANAPRTVSCVGWLEVTGPGGCASSTATGAAIP